MMTTKQPQPKKAKRGIPGPLINLQDQIAKHFDKSLFEKICVYDISKNIMKKTEQKIKVNGTDEFGLFDKIDDPKILKSLYSSLEPSKFGKEKSYVYDESVRKSRETKNVQIERVSALIPGQFAGNYDFQFYKFVIYGPGDFFSMHTDTPREGLAYSMVYTMNTDFVGGELHFKGIEQRFGGNKIVIFDPVIPHEVQKVTSGYKVSVLVNLFKKEDFSLRKMDLQLDTNLAKELFKQVDFKSFSHMNIWFSHPSQNDILEVLDEKGIKYIKAVTSEDQKIAVELDEYMDVFHTAQDEAGMGGGDEDYIDIEELIGQCSNQHDIDFVLCNENIIKGNLTRYYGFTGNSPMSSDYTVEYFKGILIIL